MAGTHVSRPESALDRSSDSTRPSLPAPRPLLASACRRGPQPPPGRRVAAEISSRARHQAAPPSNWSTPEYLTVTLDGSGGRLGALTTSTTAAATAAAAAAAAAGQRRDRIPEDPDLVQREPPSGRDLDPISAGSCLSESSKPKQTESARFVAGRRLHHLYHADLLFGAFMVLRRHPNAPRRHPIRAELTPCRGFRAN